jgi:DNA-binding response OmpR family regulator
VEDEEALRMTVGDRLRNEGYVVDCAANGDEGFEKATQIPFDLIILDVMLPGKSGFIVCRDIREAGLITPILMLTARGQTSDKVNGLKIGADDYVTKPFSLRELILRVKKLLQRHPAAETQENATDQIHLGGLHIDKSRHRASFDGKVLDLTRTEFNLAALLAERCGRVQSREQLLRDVWGYNAAIDTRTVDTHMRRLRAKLGPAANLLDTVRGVGYRFRE